VYTCICIYVIICGCIPVFVCGVYMYVCILVFVWVHVCWVACCSVSDPFDEIRTRCRRLEFVFVDYLIHWLFKDWPMGWPGDPYRFMQWRTDGNSVPKLSHFMWVFALVSFPYLSLSVLFICYLYHFMWLLDIFTNMITCITSWGINDCSHYLFSRYECLSVPFHVVLVRRCWLRLSIDTS